MSFECNHCIKNKIMNLQHKMDHVNRELIIIENKTRSNTFCVDLLSNYTYIEKIYIVYNEEYIYPINILLRITNSFIDDIYYPRLDNIEDNMLEYYLLQNTRCIIQCNSIPKKLIVTYLKYTNRKHFIYQDNKIPEYRIFINNSIELRYSYEILSDFKLCIDSQIYKTKFKKLIIKINDIIIYELDKETINILNCYVEKNNYLYINLVYLPNLYIKKLLCKNIVVELLFSIPKSDELIYLYYIGSIDHKLPNSIKYNNNILSKIEHIYIDELNDFLLNYYKINPVLKYIPNTLLNQIDLEDKSDIICFNNPLDTVNMFKYMNIILYENRKNFIIPSELWMLICTYLDQDYYYVLLLNEINNKLKERYNYVNNITLKLIILNKLLYINGFGRLFLQFKI